MKKTFILLVIIVLGGTLLACGKSGGIDRFENMDSNSFLESIDLPEHLSIDINLNEIKAVKEAKIYKADYINFDKNRLTDALIQNEVTEEKIWAEGPQVIAESGDTKEYLTIYDGGKSFGTKTGVEGGFQYSNEKKNTFWQNQINTVANVDFNDPDSGQQAYGYGINQGYGSYSDLDFMPYKEAVSKTEEVFQKAGVPEFKVDETYSLNLETMLAHYKSYLKTQNAQNDNLKDINWTQGDECYIFSLQQLIDNIPIINKTWQMPDGTKNAAFGNFMPATRITLAYGNKGIISVAASNIFSVSNEVKSNSLINIYEALSKVIEDYSSMILEEDIHITSAKLCYLSMPKDNEFELIPGWLFCSVMKMDSDGIKFKRYRYDVVNAVTGELYAGRW